MSWNLEVHILDHSAALYNKLNSKREFNPSDSANQHFKFSIDISQMILNHNCISQEDIDVKMKLFMNDLLQVESTYKEIKGLNKKGVRMYRNVKFNFKDDVLVAYHNSASDSINSQNYTVNPHFHVLLHKSVKLGLGYKYLKEAVENVAKKHKLVFSNMEKVDKPKTQGLGSKFTWFIKRATDKDFIKAFESGYLKKQLDTFLTQYKQTGNIQYLLKGYVDLQARLKRMKLKHNFDFTLFLNESQKRSIEILYSGDRLKIQELLRDRSNAIARAYLEHTKGFKSIIIDQIEQRTSQTMPIVDLDINRVDINTTSKAIKMDYTKTIGYCYSQDLESVLTYSRNEKEMAAYFKKLGYTNFKFKAKNISGSRQRVGFTFVNKNQKLTTVYFNSLKTNMKAIRFRLSENSKVSMNILPNEIHSYLENYIVISTYQAYSKTAKKDINVSKSHLIKGEFVESNGFIYSLDLLNYKPKNEFQDLVNDIEKSKIPTQEL